jgi:class 3 adenylate cyclase
MTRAVVWLAAIALPVAALGLLLARPELDVVWEHHPGHFWLVLLTAVLNVGLGFLLGEAASRRQDARVFLVSVVFLASAGFLALHALATPGVLLAGRNAGFQIASALGLLLASLFAAASAIHLDAATAAQIVRRRRVIHGALLAAMAAWAAISLTTLPPLDEPIEPEELEGPLTAVAGLGTALYAAASLRYALLYRRRRAVLLLAVMTAFVLLSEAMFAIALSPSWHASWWEWHLLMLLAFAAVGAAARREWRAEGSTAEIFADLYEERTRGARESGSFLFADLQGYTSYSERVGEEAAKAMLDDYFREARPLARDHDGHLSTIGDAVFVVFRGDGHERRAAELGLVFQKRMTEIAAAHPEWPRFRAGVNSGDAVFGVNEARDWTATGDSVNLASRLEGQARAGEVLIGPATRAALGAEAVVEDLGELPVKGRERPVRAYVLRALAAGGRERDQRLDDEKAEAER